MGDEIRGTSLEAVTNQNKELDEIDEMLID